MKTYTVRGTDREINSLGTHEPFEILVEAQGLDHAKVEAFLQRWLTREHIQITDVVEGEHIRG